MIGGKFYNIDTIKSIFYKSIIPYRSILEQELKKGTPEQTIKDMIAAGIDSPYKTGVRQNVNGSMEIFTGFSHVNAPKNTMDIGFGSNPNLKNSNFESVLRLFKGRSFVQTVLIPPEGGETVCYHMVING